MTDEMNTRSVDSLADFLLDNGIPSDFVTVFVGEYIVASYIMMLDCLNRCLLHNILLSFVL